MQFCTCPPDTIETTRGFEISCDCENLDAMQGGIFCQKTSVPVRPTAVECQLVAVDCFCPTSPGI